MPASHTPSFLSLLAAAFRIARLPPSKYKTQMQAAWGEMALAHQCYKQGEYRTAAFHLDCAQQHRLYARYFRRYPHSRRPFAVG